MLSLCAQFSVALQHDAGKYSRNSLEEHKCSAGQGDCWKYLSEMLRIFTGIFSQKLSMQRDLFRANVPIEVDVILTDV